MFNHSIYHQSMLKNCCSMWIYDRKRYGGWQWVASHNWCFVGHHQWLIEEGPHNQAIPSLQAGGMERSCKNVARAWAELTMDPEMTEIAVLKLENKKLRKEHKRDVMFDTAKVIKMVGIRDDLRGLLWSCYVRRKGAERSLSPWDL